MDNKEKVSSVLKYSKTPLKSSEIVQAAGIDKSETDKALKELKKGKNIISPKRCYYSINE